MTKGVVNIIFRAIVFFLMRLEYKQADTIALLSETFPEFEFPQSTISNWYAVLDSFSKITPKKYQRGRLNDPEIASVIYNLVKANHFISAREISKRLKIPLTTVFHYLYDVLKLRRRSVQYIPFELTRSLRDTRIVFAKVQLAILKEAKKVNYRNIMTCDESWFFYSYNPRWSYMEKKAPRQQLVRQTKNDKKIMLVPFFSGFGFNDYYVLPIGTKLNSSNFVQECIAKAYKQWIEQCQRLSPEEQQAIREATEAGIAAAKQVIKDEKSKFNSPLVKDHQLTKNEELFIRLDQSKESAGRKPSRRRKTTQPEPEPTMRDDSPHKEVIVILDDDSPIASMHEERPSKRRAMKKIVEVIEDNDDFDDEDDDDDDAVREEPQTTKRKLELRALLQPFLEALPKSDVPCFLHMDNAGVHNSDLTRYSFRYTNLIRMPQPPHSPDLSPCDYYLFGMLKQRLQWKDTTTEVDLANAVVEILNNIPEDEWQRVFDNWIKRLEWVIENDGEFFFNTMPHKKNASEIEEEKKAQLLQPPLSKQSTPVSSQQTVTSTVSSPIVGTHTDTYYNIPGLFNPYVGLVRLVNWQNTCYLNSFVQMLSSITALYPYLSSLATIPQAVVQENSPDDLKLFNAYVQFLRLKWDQNLTQRLSASFPLHSLKTALASVNIKYFGNLYHDLADVYRTILGSLVCFLAFLS